MSSPAVTRRITILIACAILFLATIAFYARDGTLVALASLFIDGAYLLAWLTAAASIGALVIQILRVTFNSTTLHIVAAAGMGLGLFALLVLCLGLLGAMNRWIAFALMAIGIAVGGAPLIATFRNARFSDHVSRNAWLWLIVAIAAGMVFVAALVPPGILFGDEPNGYDVVEYHLQVPREWYEAGRITPLHHNVYSFLPFNVEMHYLLAMHLRGGAWNAMYLAQLMHAAMIALSIAAAYGILVELGAESGATNGALLVATTPWILLLAPIAYNEGGLLLFGTLSIGLTLVALRGAQQRTRMMILAGAMAGFACGVKLTALPKILLAIPIAAACAHFLPLPSGEGRGEGASANRCILLFLLAGVVTFSPWLIRNIAWTRNPVFPEAMSVLSQGHFTDTQAKRWNLAHSPRPDQRSILARIKAARDQIIIDWRFGFIVIPLGLVAFALARNRQSWLLLVLLIEMTIVWLAFTHLQGRFFVLVIPICGLLVGLAPARWMFGAVTLAGIIGIGLLHARLMEFDRRVPLANLLALPKLDALTVLDPATLPPDAHVVLIGDARAFLYGVPMSRLHYKTVFDMDTKPDESPFDAWRKGTESLARPVVEVIDPSELARLSQTYYGIPPPPADVAARREPYLQFR